MSRTREYGEFRLAFTVVILDRYGELADAAREQAPGAVPHGVVVEALRMVDEAEPYVDPASGVEVAIPARVEWLADWALEAITTIAEDPVRVGRLPPLDEDWHEEHEQRLELLAALESLQERRLPTVLTLLGWPETEAVEALAVGGWGSPMSVEGYRAFARQGVERLGEDFGPLLADGVGPRVASLRWRLESVMAPLVWHPDSGHVPVSEAFQAELADLLAPTADGAAATDSLDEGPPVEAPDAEAGRPAAASMPRPAEPQVDPGPAGDGVSVAAGPLSSDTPPAADPGGLAGVGMWRVEDVVRLDGSPGALDELEIEEAPSRSGVRSRVLTGGGVASVVAALVGFALWFGHARPGSSDTVSRGLTKDVSRSATVRPKAGPKARPRPSGKSTKVTHKPEAAGKIPVRRQAAPVPAARVVQVGRVPVVAYRPPAVARGASRVVAVKPRAVTAAEIEAEFLP